MQDVEQQLASAGLIVDGPLEYGRLKRCKVEGDKGTKKSGWYVLHPFRLDNGNEVISGRYGNWKRYGGEGLKIELELPELTDEQKKAWAAEQKRLSEAARRERQERAKEAATRAKRIFPKLPDSGKSPYLDRKKVRAFGVRFSRGSIVVPVRNAAGDLVGLQFIAPDGEKKFLTGTAKQGAYHLVGVPSEKAPLCIAEGYATAASVHMATGWPCAVAFDAGNLKPVAQALRKLYPDLPFLFCADDDCETDGNPGVSKAQDAARAVRGGVFVPQWPSQEPANAEA